MRSLRYWQQEGTKRAWEYLVLESAIAVTVAMFATQIASRLLR